MQMRQKRQEEVGGYREGVGHKREHDDSSLDSPDVSESFWRSRAVNPYREYLRAPVRQIIMYQRKDRFLDAFILMLGLISIEFGLLVWCFGGR